VAVRPRSASVHRPPRAVLVSGAYPPDTGGPAYFVPALSAYLERCGWSVKVVALASDSSMATSTVNVVERGESRFHRRTRFIKALFQALRGADVMFANGLHTEAALVAAWARVPWVAKVVGEPIWERQRNQGTTDVSLLEFHERASKRVITLERLVWIRALSRAHKVIVPGPELFELLTDLGLFHRLTLIPNGVPTIDAYSSRRAKTTDLITVARLVPWKGVAGVISAAKRLGATLSIIGDGPERAFLQRQASRGLPAARVTFHGAIAEPAVDTFLHEARIFCLLSTYEGLSFALLRAKAAGLPVIASDIPGNRLVVRDGIDGFLVDPECPQAVDEAVKALLEDPGLAERFGSSGRDDITERFSLENTLKATETELIAAMGAR